MKSLFFIISIVYCSAENCRRINFNCSPSPSPPPPHPPPSASPSPPPHPPPPPPAHTHSPHSHSPHSHTPNAPPSPVCPSGENRCPCRFGTCNENNYECVFAAGCITGYTWIGGGWKAVYGAGTCCRYAGIGQGEGLCPGCGSSCESLQNCTAEQCNSAFNASVNAENLKLLQESCEIDDSPPNLLWYILVPILIVIGIGILWIITRRYNICSISIVDVSTSDP